MIDNLNEFVEIVFLQGAVEVAASVIALLMFIALMKLIALSLRR